MDTILQDMITNLKKFGMEINPDKSSILIQSPTTSSTRSTYQIAGLNIKTTKKIKYLGAYLTNGLNRPQSISDRLHQSSGISKSLIPFLKKTKPLLTLAKKIYNMSIAPIMSYELKGTALTKANRTQLRKYERLIMQNMATSASDHNDQTTHVKLEGKTITKRITAYRICYWAHIQRRPNNHILQRALEYQIPIKKKSRVTLPNLA
jgi:hypothetical protein